MCLTLTIILYCNNNIDSHTAEPGFSTPESTIFKYWSYLNKRDYKNALKCFKSHKEEYYDSTLIYPIPQRIESLTVDSIISKKLINKKTCTIYYRVKFYSYKDSCFKYFITGDKLVWTKNGWLIDEVFIR